MKVDDDALKQVFVNKSEIVETLQERDIFKCKAPFIYKVMKKLKNSKLNEKAVIV